MDIRFIIIIVGYIISYLIGRAAYRLTGGPWGDNEILACLLINILWPVTIIFNIMMYIDAYQDKKRKNE